MRTLRYTIIFFFFFALKAGAQQPPAGGPPQPPPIEERMKRTNEMLQREIAPTATQKTSIDKIYRDFFAKEDKLRKENPPPAQPGPPPAKVKEAMDKLVKERDEKVKKLLTADQYKKYTEAIKKLMPRPPR